MSSRLSPYRLHALLVPALIAAAISSCVTGPAISTSVDYCCGATAADINTFRVEFHDMPEFLKPMLRDEAAIALDAKGIEYTERNADAILQLSYVHDVLTPAAGTAMDVFDDTLSPATSLRFIAEVQVELQDAFNGDNLLSGKMLRLHNVPLGAYMHEDAARDALRSAFESLFAAYPSSE